MTSDSDRISAFEKLYVTDTGAWHLPPMFTAREPFDPAKLDEYMALPTHNGPVEVAVANFYVAVLALTGARTILETGTNMGYSTAKVAHALFGAHGDAAHIDTIDMIDCHPIYHEMRCRSIVTSLLGNSLEVAVPQAAYDVLILDSDHHYGTIARELERFEPLLRVGGVILMHDSVYFDGVALAVKQLGETGAYEVATLPSPRYEGGAAARCPGVSIARKKRHLFDRAFRASEQFFAVNVDFSPIRRNEARWFIDN